MYVEARSSEPTASGTTSPPTLPVATSAVSASPLHPHVASSQSSCGSSIRSPASSISRPALSSGQSSPPVDDAGQYGSLCAAGEDVRKRSLAEHHPVQVSDPQRSSNSNADIPHTSPDARHEKVTPPHSGISAVKQAMTSASDQHRLHHHHHHQHHSHHHSTHNPQHSAGTSPSIVNDIEEHAGESGPSRSVAVPTSSKTERPASKSRRMSPGGSRMPSDDPAFRNGYGRSASDSGSEAIHASKGQSSSSAYETGVARQFVRTSDQDGAGFRSPKALASDQNPPIGGAEFVNGNGTANSSDARIAKGKSTADSSDLATRTRRPHLDLASFPPQDLLRILAALLHQIATANDHLRPRNGSAMTGNDAEHRRQRTERNAAPEMALATPSGAHATGEGSTLSEPDWLGDAEVSHALITSRSKPTTAALGALDTPSSTLCFRARNIPSISIESYLLRILRYCPASCEVFVSLLVYFDRMSKMGQKSSDSNESNDVRRGKAQRARMAEGGDVDGQRGGSSSASSTSSSSVEAGDDGDPEADDGLFVGMRGFAIDGFNVHRLVIAGVTVASKFFSDVFYTNSRYAKVGGLPVHELNQLELQFLLLNDFNLMIPLDEMQKYADQLLVYGGVDPQAESSPGAGGAHSGDGVAANSASGSRTGSHDDQGAQYEDHGDVAMHDS